jgi:DMSO/TMAO reductase YedYZ molybdopterin-dependent catalytic subunit
LKKSFFQKSLLTITLGLILSLSMISVFGPNSSTVAHADVTSDSEWRLTVYGNNNNYLNLSLSDLAAMPKSTVNADLYCYGMIVTSGNWGGVNLGLLLNTAGLDRNTGTIQFRATDGYSINLPIEDALQENIIIAYEKDDQPLTEGLRLVVPGANGNIWISMITTISQTDVRVPEAQASFASSPPEPKFSLQPPQSLAPEQSNQSITLPVTPPANSQPQITPQQNSPSSSSPMDYSFLVISAIIAAFAAVSGFLFYKRGRITKTTQTFNL